MPSSYNLLWYMKFKYWTGSKVLSPFRSFLTRLDPLTKTRYQRRETYEKCNLKPKTKSRIKEQESPIGQKAETSTRDADNSGLFLLLILIAKPYCFI